VKLSLPDSVAVLGSSAFENCVKLTSIEISRTSSLREIGSNAFSGCFSLKSLFLPKCLKRFDASTFSGSAIETVTIDEENEFFAFSEGYILDKSLIVLIRSLSRAIQNAIPASVAIIDRHCFSCCAFISDIVFADGSQLRQIADFAFSECASL
jgi:hypothetical protein